MTTHDGGLVSWDLARKCMVKNGRSSKRQAVLVGSPPNCRDKTDFHGTETLEGSLPRVGDNGGLFLVSYSLDLSSDQVAARTLSYRESN